MMKSLAVILCMAVISMVASAQNVQLFYNQQSPPTLVPYDRCTPFLNNAGVQPQFARAREPAMCEYYQDKECQIMYDTAPPLDVYPGRNSPVQVSNPLPQGIACEANY